MSNSETVSGSREGKQTEQTPETLSDLVEKSPYKTTDAKVEFRQNPTRLQIEDQSFDMGICISDDRLARGVHEYQFQSGPYRIRAKRDDQSEHGTSWRIEASVVGGENNE
jgi:hypothetical protein